MGSGFAVTSSISVTNHGWGAGIRTPVLSESESDALPLGDTPLTDDIITEIPSFVNTFFKIFYGYFSVFYFLLLHSPIQYGIIIFA